MSSENLDVPYYTTAAEVVAADDSPELFLRSMFPEATPEQIELTKLYTIGKLLDGIDIGLGLCDSDDNISKVDEAFLRGVRAALTFREEQ